MLTADFGGLQGASPADVLECRLAFEPEQAPLVITRANQADLDRMEECLRGAEAAGSVAVFEVWDGALHDAIAAATQPGDDRVGSGTGPRPAASRVGRVEGTEHDT